MSGFRATLCLVLSALLLALWPGAVHAQKRTLVVALNQDPDVLDPTLARTYVGRIVFAHICEKLYEIDENLRIYPQLAADMPAVSDAGRTVTIRLRRGVKFNDGTPMDAEAVRFSLDRHRTLKGSNRRSELGGVAAVEVVDPETIRLRLKTPLSPLAAILTDRAGMPVSPAAGVDDGALREALAACGLPHLVARLDETGHWAQILSPGEQQRIAFVRALVQRPEWLFLDEATSALDEPTEAQLYRLVRARLPGTTIVSISHRSTLGAFHTRRLQITPRSGAPASLEEVAAGAAAGEPKAI